MEPSFVLPAHQIIPCIGVRSKRFGFMPPITNFEKKRLKTGEIAEFPQVVRRAGQIHNVGSRTQPQWPQPPKKEA